MDGKGARFMDLIYIHCITGRRRDWYQGNVLRCFLFDITRRSIMVALPDTGGSKVVRMLVLGRLNLARKVRNWSKLPA